MTGVSKNLSRGIPECIWSCLGCEAFLPVDSGLLASVEKALASPLSDFALWPRPSCFHHSLADIPSQLQFTPGGIKSNKEETPDWISVDVINNLGLADSCLALGTFLCFSDTLGRLPQDSLVKCPLCSHLATSTCQDSYPV